MTTPVEPDSTTNACGERLDRYHAQRVSEQLLEESINAGPECSSTSAAGANDEETPIASANSEEFRDRARDGSFFVCERHPVRKIFRSFGALVEHNRKFHALKCGNCRKIFLTAAARTRHNQRRHRHQQQHRVEE